MVVTSLQNPSHGQDQLFECVFFDLTLEWSDITWLCQATTIPPIHLHHDFIMTHPHPRQRRGGQAGGRIALLGLLVFVSGQFACELQGIPLDPYEEDAGDAGLQDASPADADRGDDMLAVCMPGLDECIGDNIRACNEQGTNYTITPCPMGTQCSKGTCVTELETCEQSDTIALSHDALSFDVSEDGKPTTNVLTVTNCSPQSLRIQKANILSALRGETHASSVFDWSADSAEVQGSILAPGAALTLKIELRPREPNWREDGTLYLSLQGGESLITREVSLRTNTWCLGTPPLLDFGDLKLDELATFRVPLHNCGTRALLLSGSALTQNTPQEGKPWNLNGSERPILIAPGSVHEVELSILPEAPGSLSGQIDLTFSPRDQLQLTTRATRIPFLARGVRTSPIECTPSTRHELLLDGELILDDDDTARPPLLPYIISLAERLPDGTLTSAVSDDEETVRFQITTQESLIDPFVISNESLFGPHALTFPNQPGRYTMRALREFIDDGEPRCEVTTKEVTFTSSSDYMVALEWYAIDDPVRDDTGAGHGADLDLYVRFINRDGSSQGWQALQDTCTAQGIEQRCAQDRGFVLSESKSGASPELIALYRNSLATRAEIGVYAHNMSGFQEACATVRIWDEGKLPQATLPLAEDAASQCVEQRAKAIQRTDNFWLLGTLDLDTGEFDDSTSIIKSRGFPID